MRGTLWFESILVLQRGGGERGRHHPSFAHPVGAVGRRRSHFGRASGREPRGRTDRDLRWKPFCANISKLGCTCPLIRMRILSRPTGYKRLAMGQMISNKIPKARNILSVTLFPRFVPFLFVCVCVCLGSSNLARNPKCLPGEDIENEKLSEKRKRPSNK